MFHKSMNSFMNILFARVMLFEQQNIRFLMWVYGEKSHNVAFMIFLGGFKIKSSKVSEFVVLF